MEGCTHVGIGENRVELTQKAKSNIIERMDSLASQGLRVLCLAGKFIPAGYKKNIGQLKRDELESGHGILGLVGI